MKDIVTLRLPEAKDTVLAGRSLASTLYGLPATILLEGELGAGKTTFLQGFASALGIETHVTSPTYALEQRYATPRGVFVHIDLYRLSSAEARALLQASDDAFAIRCIEWAERLEGSFDEPHVAIRLSDDEKGGRELHAEFRDAPLPSEADIRRWRDDVRLPENIRKHCDAVANYAVFLASLLQKKGMLVRTAMLKRAGLVHDLFRFVDFQPNAGPQNLNIPAADARVHDEIRDRYPNMRHEPVCASFLREKGYAALAEVVEVHGLKLPSPARTTIEQKLLYYADKRVRMDDVVTLQERFDDFSKRYGGGKWSDDGKLWYAEAQAIERELFPEGAPPSRA